MSSTMKVLDIADSIHLVCIKHISSNSNPYRLYIVYSQQNEYGYYTKRRKQLAAYGNMASVICHIKDMYVNDVHLNSIDFIIKWNKAYTSL